MQQIELVGELGVWSERGRASVWLHASDSYMFLLLYKDPQEGKESHLMKGRGMRGEVSLSLGRGEVGGRVIRYFVCCFEKSTCSKASRRCSKLLYRVFSVVHHSFGVAVCISLRASATSAGFDVLRVISEAPATCLAYGT